ncbi:hypothetical protein B7494_g1399 [Chlorociboria aeruginascens]|nr:hypothetical protein B7494_g1399 [Chlorociboria aeruginascens]
MFSVPGWSINPSNLKTQSLQLSTPIVDASILVTNEADPRISTPSSRKRKHGSGKPKAAEVNSANFASLWETVIEGKTKSTSKSKSKDKTVNKGGEDPAPVEESTETSQNAAEEPGFKERKKQKTLKEKKREKKAAAGVQQIHEIPVSTEIKTAGMVTSPRKTTAKPAVSSRPTTELTPLQASMRQKLISARFRHLNQTLYTTPSSHSLTLFQENPEMFQEYHQGFRRQVEVWPENPVDTYLLQLKSRGEQRGPQRSKGAHIEDTSTETLVPLPRTGGICRIADLGCGDAMLSQNLQKDLKKLKLQIHSYDLQNPSPIVTKADIADLPLEDNSVDIAILCLALMGTNWIDFIEEAFRILRWKGELWISEIKSRFGRVNAKNKRVEHSVGNRKKPDKKMAKKMEEEADDADLMVEVDGQEDSKQETDVSAFVEVLRKRGFALHGDNAVDLSNKMFVKMSFVKGLTPVKGKCVPVPKGMVEMGMETWKRKPKMKFLDDEEAPALTEASILKPCVYKLR